MYVLLQYYHNCFYSTTIVMKNLNIWPQNSRLDNMSYHLNHKSKLFLFHSKIIDWWCIIFLKVLCLKRQLIGNCCGNSPKNWTDPIDPEILKVTTNNCRS